jgi:hypothetical protein
MFHKVLEGFNYSRGPAYLTSEAAHNGEFFPDKHLAAAIGCLTIAINSKGQTIPAKAVEAYDKALSYPNDESKEAERAFDSALDICEDGMETKFNNVHAGDKIRLYAIDSLVVDQVTGHN